MKQVKMNLSEELKTYFKSQDGCKKKQNLKKACKILFILGEASDALCLVVNIVSYALVEV